ALLALLLAAMLASSDGARRFAFVQGLRLTVPGLAIEGATGDPLGRLVIGWLTWQDAAREIHARDVTIEVERWSLAARRLVLGRFAIGALEITQRAPSPPAPPPTSLELPLDLAFERIELGRVLWRSAPAAEPLALGPFAGTAALGRREHAVRLEQAVTPWFEGDARITLDARTLALAGEARLASRAEAVSNPWRLRLTLGERLPDLALQIALESRAQHARLSARLAPFAAQPLSRVDARLDRVDLAAFVPGLPHTALTGTVRADLSDLSRPSAELALDNALAGAWDAGRLPIARVSGRLAQVDSRLHFDRIEARLGDAEGSAGRLSLAGEWRDEGWQLSAFGEAIDFTRLGLALPGRLEALEFTAQNRGRTPTEAVAATLRGRWQPPADAPRREMQPLLLHLASQVGSSGAAFRVEASVGASLVAAVEAQRAGAEATAPWLTEGRLQLAAFDARWFSPWLPVQPGDVLSGEATAAVRLARPAKGGLHLLEGSGRWRLSGARLAGLALDSDGRIETVAASMSAGPRVLRGAGELRWGGQRLAWQGGVGAVGERLRLMLDLPALETLAGVAQALHAGGLDLTGDIKGAVELVGLGASPPRSAALAVTPAIAPPWPVEAVVAELTGRRTALAGVAAEAWSLEAQATNLSGPLDAAAVSGALRAQALTLARHELRQVNDGQPLRLTELTTRARGTLAAHDLSLEGQVSGLAVHPETIEARLALAGGAHTAQAARGWQGRLTEARLARPKPKGLWFALDAPLAIEVERRADAREIRLGAGSVRLD
ncbi:MAG: hypothetical protein ACK4XK_12095, partial [Casimicrobiaceae bacterium]